MKKLLVVFYLVFSVTFYSQEKQPKVGLVLSGGGAKGFAHIGVLKEIDKAGLQIDYVGGTSMGAIVGGLYAIGYSGEQIEQIVLKTDFVSLLQDKLPRNSEPFFEKEFGEKTFITLPVHKGAVGFPKAVSKGQNVLNFLMELLASVEGISDFVSNASLPQFNNTGGFLGQGNINTSQVQGANPLELEIQKGKKVGFNKPGEITYS